LVELMTVFISSHRLKFIPPPPPKKTNLKRTAEKRGLSLNKHPGLYRTRNSEGLEDGTGGVAGKVQITNRRPNSLASKKTNNPRERTTE